MSRSRIGPNSGSAGQPGRAPSPSRHPKSWKYVSRATLAETPQFNISEADSVSNAGYEDEGIPHFRGDRPNKWGGNLSLIIHHLKSNTTQQVWCYLKSSI